jgi:putative ABC transport system permease protein
MSIVSLQLVGQMISQTLTSNIRELNGGDLSISSTVTPFTMQNITFFDQLKKAGHISTYTPIFADNNSSVQGFSTHSQKIQLFVVHPDTFPVVGSPRFENPPHATFNSILANVTIQVS